MPLQMFVFPVREGTPLPDVFTKFADVAERPALAAARGDRREPRPSGSSSGPAPCCGERRAGPRVRARCSRVPVVFLGVFFAWPVVAIVGRGLAPGRRARPRPARRRRSATPALRHVVVVHGVAGGAVDRAHAARSRSPARSCSRATDFRGRAARARARHRAVRAADRRGGSAFLALLGAGGPLGDLGLDGSSGRSCSRTSSSTTRSSCAPSAGSGRTSTRARKRRRGMLGASRWRTFRAVTLPALRPAIVGRGVDRVPLLLHVVRRDPRARRPAVRDARDGDLPADRASCSTSRSRPRSPLVQLVAVAVLLAVTARGSEGRRAAALGLRSAAATARRPRTRRRTRSSPANLARDGGAARRPDRRARRTLVAHADGLRIRLLPRARRAAPRQRALRAADSTRSGTRCAYAVVATVIAARRRWLRAPSRSRDRRGPRRSTRPRSDAPARRVGGDGRLRVPHRARRAAARPADVVGDRPDRARADRDPVRRAHDDSRCCSRSTPACAKPRRARRVAAPGRGARSTCRSSRAPLLVAAGFAFAISLGEFGATLFIVAARHADAAGR